MHLLENWSRLKSQLGDAFRPTFFGKEDTLDWWSHVADFADNYPEARDELLDKLSLRHDEQLHSELLFFLARHRPRSAALLGHCLRTITGKGRVTGRWIDVDTAAFLLGRDFGGDPDVLGAFLPPATDNAFLTTDMLLAVAEGWPEEEVLTTAFRSLLSNSSDKSLIPIQSIVHMHILCTKGSSEQVVSSVMMFVRGLGSEDFSYQCESYLRPLLRRVRKDEEAQLLLRKKLICTRHPSQLYTAASVLNRAIGADPALKAWCLDHALKKPTVPLSFTPLGFDLTIGRVRAAYEVGMEIMCGSIQSMN